MDKLFGDRPPADARAGAERPICGRSTDANDGGCRAPQLAGHEPYGRVSRPAVSRYSAFNDRYSTSTFTFRDGMSCHGLAAQTLTVHLLFPDTTMAPSNAWRCSSTYTVSDRSIRAERAWNRCTDIDQSRYVAGRAAATPNLRYPLTGETFFF